jgi:hemerythrin-like domain-containing protein
MMAHNARGFTARVREGWPGHRQRMVVEHRLFLALFDQIERRLPALETLAEVKLLAALVEELLRSHGEQEENLSYAALDHALAERGQIDCLYQEHDEIDGRLQRIKAVQHLPEARQLLAAVIKTARKHFQREERVVFPLIEQVLPQHALARLGGAWVQAEPIPIAHGR